MVAEIGVPLCTATNNLGWRCVRLVHGNEGSHNFRERFGVPSDIPTEPEQRQEKTLDTSNGVYVNLQQDGLLWAINRSVLHPRGYALGMDEDGALALYGDGSEVIRYDGIDEDEHKAHFDTLLKRADRTNWTT